MCLPERAATYMLSKLVILKALPFSDLLTSALAEVAVCLEFQASLS